MLFCKVMGAAAFGIGLEILIRGVFERYFHPEAFEADYVNNPEQYWRDMAEAEAAEQASAQ